jgi:hypothetical protein
MDMYSIKSQLTNQLEIIGSSFVNLGQVSNDHAHLIDELRSDLEDMLSLVRWIGEVHPDVIKQHLALHDIQRASN